MKTKIFFLALFQIVMFYQNSNSQNLPVSTTTYINFDSDKHIRIFDGFLIPQNGANPANLKINSVTTGNDAERAKIYHLPISKKPYIILSTEVTDLRSYIYKLANLSLKFRDKNLPIVLNGELITFDKYAILDKLDQKNIVKAEWSDIKKVTPKTQTPFGVIKVIAN